MAGEPDEHGVEWLSHSDRYRKRSMPLPRSLISEIKWTEAKKRSHGRINWKKYRPSKKQIPDLTVARSKKAPGLPLLPVEDRPHPHR